MKNKVIVILIVFIIVILGIVGGVAIYNNFINPSEEVIIDEPILPSTFNQIIESYTGENLKGSIVYSLVVEIKYMNMYANEYGPSLIIEYNNDSENIIAKSVDEIEKIEKQIKKASRYNVSIKEYDDTTGFVKTISITAINNNLKENNAQSGNQNETQDNVSGDTTDFYDKEWIEAYNFDFVNGYPDYGDSYSAMQDLVEKVINNNQKEKNQITLILELKTEKIEANTEEELKTLKEKITEDKDYKMVLSTYADSGLVSEITIIEK